MFAFKSPFVKVDKETDSANLSGGIANGRFANANARVPLANIIVVNADTSVTHARRPRCFTLSARRVKQGLSYSNDL